MTQDLEIQLLEQGVSAINPQALTELGAIMATTGMTTLEARALVADIQSVAAQTSLTMAPKILETIRRIQEHRIMEIYNQIRLLPNQLGYVNRDRVLAIVQNVATRTPRQ